MDNEEKGALLEDHYTSLTTQQQEKYFGPAPAVTDLKSLEKFRKSEAELKALPENVREFYKAQNNQLDAFAVAQRIKATGIPEKTEEKEAEDAAKGNYAVRLSFACNILLFALKITAAALSASLAIVASTIDSLLDLLSGSILFLTSRAIDKRDPYKYPEGKSRLEPLGVVIFAIVMAMAAIQLLSEAVQILAEGFANTAPEVNMGPVPLAVLCFVIALKLFLHIYCRRIASLGNFPGVEALAQDHFNDVATNIIALGAAIVAAEVSSLWFFDPVGAIVLSGYIVRNWVRTGRGQFRYIVGKAAPPDFLAQLTYMAAHHDPNILRVDTVLAYHWGMKFLVEVHIALNKETSLKVAHDIGETLEEQYEKLELVERAFVHLDYEWLHTPEYHRRQKKPGDHFSQLTSQQVLTRLTSQRSMDHPTGDSPQQIGRQLTQPVISRGSTGSSTDDVLPPDPAADTFRTMVGTTVKQQPGPGGRFKVVNQTTMPDTVKENPTEQVTESDFQKPAQTTIEIHENPEK